jgi:tetratricopeptide (TPR) repeat protein
MKKKLKKDEEKTVEEKLINGISGFFEKNLKTILIAVAAVVVVVLAVVLIVNSSSNSKDSAQIKISEMEEKYSELLAAEEPDWDSFETELSAMVRGSSYPSVKASYLLGLAHYDQEEYTEARDAFKKAYELNKDIYLAPLALVNEAACEEALENDSAAIELYNQIANDYPESGVAAKALFNLGRIYYQQGSTELAKTVFEQVATDYPNSEYGKLGKNLANVL